jgi:hypothetical protein
MQSPRTNGWPCALLIVDTDTPEAVTKRRPNLLDGEGDLADLLAVESVVVSAHPLENLDLPDDAFVCVLPYVEHEQIAIVKPARYGRLLHPASSNAARY